MKLSALLLLFLGISMASAQDVIYLKGHKDSIVVKILEINSSEIKFRPVSDSVPILYYTRAQVRRVVLARGIQVFDFEGEEDLGRSQKLSSLKMAFLSPLFNQLSFSFESYIKKRSSWEATASAIGVGFNENFGSQTPTGAFGKIGFKLISSEKVNANVEPRKLISGFYTKPELTLGFLSIDYGSRSNPSSYPDKDITFGAVMINLGYQYAFSNGFTVDTYFGLGYAKARQSGGIRSSHSSTNEYYYYAFLTLDPDRLPLALSAGIKIGYTFYSDYRK